MQLRSLFGCSMVLSGLLSAAGSFAEPTTIKSGVYTSEQAAQGKPVFEQYCAACHVKEFYEIKFSAWKGQPLSGLYDAVSASMPEDNAGGLMLQEYTDVFAYIFSLLEYPAGEQPLDHTDGSMDSILVD